MVVCTGAGIDQDATGRISLAVCGPREDAIWPHLCPPGSANPVRLDDSGCLWLAPHGWPSVTWAQGSVSAPGTASVGSPILRLAVASLAVANLDPCRDAEAMIEVWTDWEGVTSAGGVYLFGKQVLGVDSPDGSMITHQQDESPASATRKSTSLTVRRITGIAPGASALVTVNMQVSVTSGTFQVATVRATIGATVVVPEP